MVSSLKWKVSQLARRSPDRRPSRPTQNETAPDSNAIEPSTRPTWRTASSVKVLSTMPRMSYALKIEESGITTTSPRKYSHTSKTVVHTQAKQSLKKTNSTKNAFFSAWELPYHADRFTVENDSCQLILKPRFLAK